MRTIAMMLWSTTVRVGVCIPVVRRWPTRTPTSMEKQPVDFLTTVDDMDDSCCEDKMGRLSGSDNTMTLVSLPANVMGATTPRDNVHYRSLTTKR